MPVVVPETSVLHAPSHNPAGRSGNPSGSAQAAGAFSQLLDGPDPALDTAARERPDAADRERPESSPRDDKARAKRQQPDGPPKEAKVKNDKGAKNADETTARADAKTAPSAPSNPKEPEAETPVNAAPNSEVAASETESDLLLASEIAALGLANQPVSPTVAPVPAPITPSESIPVVAGADAVAQIAAAGIEAAVAAPAPAAMPTVAAEAAVEATPAADSPDSPRSAALLKQAVAEPKADTAAKSEGPVTRAPASSVPMASVRGAAEFQNPEATGPRTGVQTSTVHANVAPDALPAAERRPELPTAAMDTNVARIAPETASNPTPSPAPSAVTGPAVAHIAPTPTGPAGPVIPVPIEGLAVEIAARAQSGKNHFQIRLDPPELGRIDVRLDVDREGNVTSRLVVERVETLDLLRRDAANLERAFQQAGLKTSDNGLQFSLRDQAFSHRDNGGEMPAMARLVVSDDNLAPIETERSYGRLAGLGGGVDIRV